MSSPIASSDKSVIKKALINFHQKASHNYRVDLLAGMLGGTIDNLYPDKEKIKCLDIGCGDMTIAETIAENHPKTDWTCIDIHPLPKELEGEEKWKKYRQFDGLNIPFEDNTFQAALFVDVLHHIDADLTNNLKEAARVSETVIIKDHFEYTLYSRNMLKVMDIVGNWGYGVSIPDKYFSKKRFQKLVDDCGLEIVDIDAKIPLYQHNFVLNTILRPEWQFIAVLRKKK